MTHYDLSYWKDSREVLYPSAHSRHVWQHVLNVGRSLAFIATVAFMAVVAGLPHANVASAAPASTGVAAEARAAVMDVDGSAPSIQPSAPAAILTCVVTNTLDSGVGSLRQALKSVCGSGMVTFDGTVFATPQTIQLASGLNITQNLMVDGAANGVAAPTVKGPGPGATYFRVMTITANMKVTLNQLIIASGNLTGATSSQAAGAGIYNLGSLTVTNSVITGNVTSSAGGVGGGIYSTGAIQIISTTLSNNTAASTGGGINSTGYLTITSSIVKDNTSANNGGGIYLNGANTSIISNTLIHGNTAGLGGGGIFDNAALLLSSSSVYSNTATGNYGGGMVVAANKYAMATDSLFYDNISVAAAGGGISANGMFEARHIHVYRNTSTYSGGGISSGNRLTMTNSSVYQNTTLNAGGPGGGIGSTAIATLVNVDVYSNTSASGLGGGISTVSPLYMTGGSLFGNTNGGTEHEASGIYANSGLTITVSAPYTYSDNIRAGIVFSADGDITLTTGTATLFHNAQTTTTLTNPGTTIMKNLYVAWSKVLDVGSAVVSVTGLITNTGIIMRLAPTQTVSLGADTVYNDGAGYPTAILRQTSGTPMGDTSLLVKAGIKPSTFGCGNAQFSVLGGVIWRLFTFNSAAAADTAVDMTLYYHDRLPATVSEANGVELTNTVLLACDGNTWTELSGNYTRGEAGNYKWVKLDDVTPMTYTSFAVGSRSPISLTLDGAGGGTVTSSPDVLNCQSNGVTPVACAGSILYGQVVTLTATPLISSTFSGWSGVCTGTALCVLPMTTTEYVTATFTVNTYTLQVAYSGTGGGSVSVDPELPAYDYGAVITLTATPSITSVFMGWLGASDATANPVAVTITADSVITATFDVNWLYGRVALERRGVAGDARWVTPLYRVNALSVITGGLRFYAAGTSNLVDVYTATTDANGFFTATMLGSLVGQYDIVAKGANTLGSKRLAISLPTTDVIDFGTLLVGDSSGDERINGADVSYMVPSFLQCTADGTFRPYGDTNADGCINGADVSALIPNFLKQGPITTSLTLRPVADTSAMVGTSNIALSRLPGVLQAGDVFTVAIQVSTGAASADTVDAYLNYDAALLEATGTAALNTAVFGSATLNTFDNGAGTFNLSMSRYTGPWLHGAYTVATVTLRAKTDMAAPSVQLARSGSRYSELYMAGESLQANVSALGAHMTFLPLAMR